jgi:hypothetical protein
MALQGGQFLALLELVPDLWKRQLTRREYGHEHFRDNLMAF